MIAALVFGSLYISLAGTLNKPPLPKNREVFRIFVIRQHCLKTEKHCLKQRSIYVGHFSSGNQPLSGRGCKFRDRDCSCFCHAVKVATATPRQIRRLQLQVRYNFQRPTLTKNWLPSPSSLQTKKRKTILRSRF